MASAWGDSWSNYWGDSWGQVDETELIIGAYNGLYSVLYGNIYDI